MGIIAMGGASGAVAASAHAACERFRGTDPLITKTPRRELAKALPVQGDLGGIPLARWIRAMTFESLVRDQAFASQIATTAIGNAGLSRPKAVVVADGKSDVAETRKQLELARDRAVTESVATLIHTTAVPHPGFDPDQATAVLPDFVVVAADEVDADDAWVIVGDAKDYERIRSRIDDARMLKGFVQVAFGAEALEKWADLPAGLNVHGHGVLAVPRNAFLQPTAITEDLRDHRTEVQMRLAERLEEAQKIEWTGDPETFVAHLQATFDPNSCSTCSLFAYCRNELRTSCDPADYLAELGVAKHLRSSLVGLVDGTGEPFPGASPLLTAQVLASALGYPQSTGQNRIDVVGEPATINVAIAKSDSAALGVHGIAVQVITDSGPQPWNFDVFTVPQADATRRAVMGIIGDAAAKALAVTYNDDADARRPIHIVTPDKATGDLLTSIADSLAGVEISRLRWEHDVAQGREPLTFDGNPATIPQPITPQERLAVSFLLEDDRARAFKVRMPIVDVREALLRVMNPGGPNSNFGRLDYLVGWAKANASAPLDARSFADSIEVSLQTPGARLTNKLSDRINEANGGGKKPANPARYDELVRESLQYKVDVFNDAVSALKAMPGSKLREAYRSIEGDAQAIWRRRNELQAHDLIRFSSTSRFWRNSLVSPIQDDGKCDAQLRALTMPTWAEEKARDAGTRDLAVATVASLTPLTLDVGSRKITSGTRIVLLHVNGQARVEHDDIEVKLQKGSVKVTGLPAGPLTESSVKDAPKTRLVWTPNETVDFAVGDELVIANFEWFTKNSSSGSINVNRPSLDAQFAPKPSCTPESYSENPEEHKWCCQPHVHREAAISDLMAQRRDAGELNPQIWPPVMDQDSFDVTAHGEATDTTVEPLTESLPVGVTLDDLE
jgi:hypothetical protein